MNSQSQQSVLSEVLRGIRASLPMVLGYVPIGLILGTSAVQAGVSPLGTTLMCSINFAGGSEFAALALWAATPPVLAILLTTWLINSRHIMLSAALTPYVTHLKLRDALLVFFLMCDETWALSMQDISRKKKGGATESAAFSYPFYLGVGVTLWANWWGFACIGAFIGGGIGDLSEWGISMAFPVIFISILASMWPGVRKCLPLAVSAVVSALTSLAFSSGVSVALGSLAGLAAAWVLIVMESEHV